MTACFHRIVTSFVSYTRGCSGSSELKGVSREYAHQWLQSVFGVWTIVAYFLTIEKRLDESCSLADFLTISLLALRGTNNSRS